jgi:autophagy-related protein 5
VPLRLTLHLATPPNDKLQLSPSAEACKQAFMGQLKEADFLRWGNTKRMTGLRKAEQDGMWEGIKERSSNFVFRSSPFPNLPKPNACQLSGAPCR